MIETPLLRIIREDMAMGEMRERLARAICSSVGKEPDSPFRDRHGKALDFPEWQRWGAEASAALQAQQIPTNRMVAAAADELGMDATKVAAVWMVMIREALGGDDGK